MMKISKKELFETVFPCTYFHARRYFRTDYRDRRYMEIGLPITTIRVYEQLRVSNFALYGRREFRVREKWCR